MKTKKIVALEVLPKQADLARLKFKEQADKYRSIDVVRKGSNITIEFNEETEIIFLKGGKQLLLIDRKKGKLWFGGTDEQPFLSSMDWDLVEIIDEVKSEEDFYEAMKPDQVQWLEATLGVQTRRQGDIFAYPLPFSWGEIMLHSSIVPVPVEQWSVFGTRHLLTGVVLTYQLLQFFMKNAMGGTTHGDGYHEPTYTPLVKSLVGDLYKGDLNRSQFSYVKIVERDWPPNTIVMGTIEAPDHTPLALLDRPFLLARTGSD